MLTFEVYRFLWCCMNKMNRSWCNVDRGSTITAASTTLTNGATVLNGFNAFAVVRFWGQCCAGRGVRWSDVRGEQHAGKRL